MLLAGSTMKGKLAGKLPRSKRMTLCADCLEESDKPQPCLGFLKEDVMLLLQVDGKRIMSTRLEGAKS